MDWTVEAKPGAEGRSLTTLAEVQGQPRHALAAEIACAVRVFDIEAGALRLLAGSIARENAQSFVHAIDAIAACAGRVVVSGMGKFGIVGRKIATTLAATGTLAHFVHPAEASYGDLGMIAAGDIVLVLSDNGETPELGDLLTYADRLAIPVVAITGNAGSSLARRSDVLLLLPDAPEACPLGLAPTSSTTMMTALGDAITAALVERRQFTPGDYRLRHPAGQMGRRLPRVEDLIGGHNQLPLVHLDSLMSEVILMMGRTGYGTAGVIDDHGDLVGLIAEGDLRRHMGPDLLTRPAAEVMSETTVSVQPDTPAAEALHAMTSLQVSNLFVTEGTRPIAILHIEDCRRAHAA